MTLLPPSDDIKVVLLTLYETGYRPLDTDTLHAMHEICESIGRYYPRKTFSVAIDELVTRLLRLKVLRGIQFHGEAFVSLTDSGFDLAETAYVERFSLGFVDPCRHVFEEEPSDGTNSENVA
ncbi:MAG: hypothetical protein ACEQSB_03025 [Undibacterium sp.]